MAAAVTTNLPSAPEADTAHAPALSREDLLALLNYTRNWIQYGVVGFAVACIFIGAVERLFGR